MFLMSVLLTAFVATVLLYMCVVCKFPPLSHPVTLNFDASMTASVIMTSVTHWLCI